MNANDLQPFCSTDECREHLLKPFSAGGFTYATDGRCAVRVPRLPDIAENAMAPKTIESLFADEYKPSAPTYDLPELPAEAISKCKKCHGNGRLRKCMECDGEGERGCDMGHSHECDECDGDGWFPTSADKGEPCFECEGSGTHTDSVPVSIGPANFSNLILAKLKPLPDCKVHVPSESGVASFTFNGGVGLLMPMRK